MANNTVGKTDIRHLWDSIKQSIYDNSTGSDTYSTFNTLVEHFLDNKISMDQFRTDFEIAYSSLENETIATIIEPLLTAIGLRELEEDVGNPNFADGITNTDSMSITFASLKTELISKSDSLDNGELTSTDAAQELFGIIAEHVRNEDVIATNPETKANLVDDKDSLKAAFDSFIVKKLQDDFGGLSLNAGSTLTDLANAIETILDTALSTPHLKSSQILTYLQNSKLDKDSTFDSDIAKNIHNITLASDGTINSNNDRANDIAIKLVAAIKSGASLTEADNADFSSLQGHIAGKVKAILDNPDNYLYDIGLDTIKEYENDGSFDNFAEVISTALDTDVPSDTINAVKIGLNNQDLETEITTPLIEALEGKDIANAIATAITDVLNNKLTNVNLQADIEARALENVRDSLVAKTLTTGKDISEFASEIKEAINGKQEINSQELITDLQNADLTQLKNNIKAVADKDYDVDESEVVPPNQYNANYDDYKVTTFISDLQAATGYSDVARNYAATITGKMLEQVFERESVLFEHNRIKDALTLAFKNAQINRSNVANQIVLAGLTDWSAANAIDASALISSIKDKLPRDSVSLSSIISTISNTDTDPVFINDVNTLDGLGTKLKDALCTSDCGNLEENLQKALRGDAIIATQSYLEEKLEPMAAVTFTNLAEALTESMLSLSTITEIKNDETATPAITDFDNFRDEFFKADLEKQNVKLIKADLKTTLNNLLHDTLAGNLELSAENIAKAIFTEIGATNAAVTQTVIVNSISAYDYTTITNALTEALNGQTTIAGIANAFSSYLAGYRDSFAGDKSAYYSDSDYQEEIRYEIIDNIKTKVGTITANGQSFADGFDTVFPDLATILDDEWIKSDWRDDHILTLLKAELNNIKVSEFKSKFTNVLSLDTGNPNYQTTLQDLVEKVQAQILANRLKGLSGSTTNDLAESFYTEIAPVGISDDDIVNIKSDFAEVSVKSAVNAINTALVSADTDATSLAAKIVDTITTLDGFNKETLKTLLANYLRTEEAYDDITSITDALGNLNTISDQYASVTEALGGVVINGVAKSFYTCTKNLEGDYVQDANALISHQGDSQGSLLAIFRCADYVKTQQSYNYFSSASEGCLSTEDQTQALLGCIGEISPIESANG